MFRCQCQHGAGTAHLANLVRRRNLAVQIAERDALCEDRRLITSGGAGASAHLLLHLIRCYGSLESTRMTLDSITFKVGYEDSNSFRRLFQQRVGMQAASYREKFQTQAT